MSYDHDAGAVYLAEDATMLVETSQRLDTLAVAREVMNDVQARTFGGPFRTPPTVTVMFGQGKNSMAYDDQGGTIVLAPDGRNKYTLLHEYAHLLTTDGHGPRFRQALLYLTRSHIGVYAYSALAFEFNSKGLSTNGF